MENVHFLVRAYTLLITAVIFLVFSLVFLLGFQSMIISILLALIGFLAGIREIVLTLKDENDRKKYVLVFNWVITFVILITIGLPFLGTVGSFEQIDITNTIPNTLTSLSIGFLILSIMIKSGDLHYSKKNKDN
ncbi:hypothetical protein [Alkalibacillus haloalkaliphilus]|uniref:hypothetical protein n=1 Tax=Alkalibacillus haloalkaliphilus TaxID=94136 RepID=UPI00293624E8|nr:hypothetical protein [Alkalibacillus haloalkaliphilus]MDV2581679.1 hypothetical protein [Alkalibacillus haloalkaliphilus]